MSLQGLPDFQQPIQLEGLTMFYPYESRGNYTILPDRLTVAKRSDEQPDFQLVLVRGQSWNLPPAPYGMLDFRIQPHHRLQEGLTILRDRHPGATLTPAPFASGFLHLRPVKSGDAIPPELLSPIPLDWNDLGTARSLIKLSTSAASLIKDSLQRGLLALYARAEMEIIGVAPRLPLRVRFNPAELLETLLTLSDSTGHVNQEDIVTLFRDSLAALPLEIAGNVEPLDRTEVAETLTDWVRSRFSTTISLSAQTDAVTLALQSPKQVGSGSIEWNLAQPIQVLRPLVLDLKPFEAAQQLVQQQGLTAVVQEVTVPNIPTGQVQIAISANLPAHRPGVVALGAHFHIPARFPVRPQPINRSVEFNSPDDSASVLLRLSPTENLEYTYSTFVVLEDGDGIIQLESESMTHQGDRLKLYPHHFPVKFVSIEASRALLRLATLHGICCWQQDNAPAKLQFQLTAEQPAIAITLPKDTDDAELTIEARSLHSAKSLWLNSLPAKRLWLDLFSFPQYGPQQIEIHCAFSQDSSTLFAIDLLPEGKPETPDTITTLHFTPAQPVKIWSWFAASPFQNGYRYRVHPGDSTPAAWSAICLPPDRLELFASLHPGLTSNEISQ